jgi:hypothetical protein
LAIFGNVEPTIEIKLAEIKYKRSISDNKLAISLIEQQNC